MQEGLFPFFSVVLLHICLQIYPDSQVRCARVYRHRHLLCVPGLSLLWSFKSQVRRELRCLAAIVCVPCFERSLGRWSCSGRRASLVPSGPGFALNKASTPLFYKSAEAVAPPRLRWRSQFQELRQCRSQVTLRQSRAICAVGSVKLRRLSPLRLTGLLSFYRISGIFIRQRYAAFCATCATISQPLHLLEI